MPKLFIVVNEDRFFLSHRKPIALAACAAGFDTFVIAKNTGYKNEIESLGLKMIEMPIDPTGMNPFHEWKTIWFLFNLYRKHHPDIVHHVGMKDILWGSLAAKLLRIPSVVNAISGLGGLFNGGKTTLTTKGILTVLRFSNNQDKVKFIFQNNDDKNIFLQHKVVNLNQIEFTHGSGIDLNEYSYSEAPSDEKIKIIFTARMIKEKGVYDLIDAAELLKSEYKDKVTFLLCGRLTPNKTGVSKEYMLEHCDGKYICWLGEQENVRLLLEQSHIMAFPSYYREGVPKSLIEACAIGRPIITCDSVGCRDVVDDGINGILINPRNQQQLVDALKMLIENPDLRLKMGKAGRKKAERLYDIETVVDTHLKIYNDLMSKRK